MKVSLEPEETTLLEIIRSNVAAGIVMGVTVIDDHMVLRTNEGSVMFQVRAFGPGTMQPDICLTCGGNVSLKDAQVIVQQANGDDIRWTDKTCTYCRVPK